MKKTIGGILIMMLAFGSVFAGQESLINRTESPVKVYFEVETGLFGVLNHTYQTGQSAEGASRFDFVTQGGQDILFSFDRYVAGLIINEKHNIGLLYQPLTVVTNVTFREDVMIDSVSFSAGTRFIVLLIRIHL